MAVLSGSDGSFKFGATDVAEVTKFSLKITPIIAERHLIGSSTPNRDNVGSDWSVDIEGKYDESDSGGQDEVYDSLINGTKIADMSLYTSSNDYFSSTSGIVTDYTVETTGGGVVEFSATISADGAGMTRTVV